MEQPSGKQSIEQRVSALVEPIARLEGAELVDIEYAREHQGWVLRLYIDKPGGVGLEDCAQVSHACETALDVEGFISNSYHLEVSSPGLNRPLTKKAHFEGALDKRVRVKSYGPLGEPPGRKSFLGTLRAVADDEVVVDVDGAGAFHIPFKDIAKANLEFDLGAHSAQTGPRAAERRRRR